MLSIRQFTLVEHDEASIDPHKVYKGSIGKLPKPGSIQRFNFILFHFISFNFINFFQFYSKNNL